MGNKIYDTKYDHLSPVKAAHTAWRDHGVRPAWHTEAREIVRKELPELAEALDGDEYSALIALHVIKPPSPAIVDAMPLLARAMWRIYWAMGKPTHKVD